LGNSRAMNDLVLYDTLTREKRRFEPGDPERVTMYVCGPTVYNYAHIGNFRPVVVFDVLFRLLRRLYGEDHVLYAANVTDVDDKINQKAAAEGVPISVITGRYLEAYNADAAALGALRPTFQPRATETMDAIVAMIGELVGNNAAYAAEGHVLFSTEAFADYGRLSGRPLDELIAGARVDVAPYKRDPRDFVLWKPSKPGEPEWESPWGPGRPGWHIECTAMIAESLGLPIDIHGGGIDLVFPHHENELAQGVCSGHGREYARVWMHNGFLNMAEEKMSKSLGNVALAHDLLAEYPGEAIRWALLSGHYRQPLEWTDELIEQSRRSLDTLYGALRRANAALQNADHLQLGQGDPSYLPLQEQLDGFTENTLYDDLNTPKAYAMLAEFVWRLNQAIDSHDLAQIAFCRGLLREAGRSMGFLEADPEAWFHGGANEALKGQVEALIAARAEARAARDWPEADRIRAELDALGVDIMDGAGGTTWRTRSQ